MLLPSTAIRITERTFLLSFFPADRATWPARRLRQSARVTVSSRMTDDPDRRTEYATRFRQATRLSKTD